jgi:hypothetical protein
MAGGGGDDSGVLVEAVVVPDVVVFDLASLAAAAGLTVAELTAEVDPNSADLEELCRSFGVGLPAKIKIKVELRAARKVQGETREAELAAERAALEQPAAAELQQPALAAAQAEARPKGPTLVQTPQTIAATALRCVWHGSGTAPASSRERGPLPLTLATACLAHPLR